MTTLVADASLHQKLGQVHEVTSIEDTTGRFLGYFSPKAYSPEEVQSYSDALVYFTPERLAQAKALSGAGLSLDEVWQQLEQRKAAKCDSP